VGDAGRRTGHHRDTALAAEHLRSTLDDGDRFLELIATVGEQPSFASQGAPSFESMEWLTSALASTL